MAGEPNELPEGGDDGGSGFPWGGIRGEFPQELPVAVWRERSTVALLREVLTVRTRLQRLENAQIAASVLGRGGSLASFGIGGPNELPEGGEGGGGGGHWPGEFPGEIAELPVDRFVLQRVAELDARLSAFESRVVAALESLEAQILKKR
jgi:hypothetical protein